MRWIIPHGYANKLEQKDERIILVLDILDNGEYQLRKSKIKLPPWGGKVSFKKCAWRWGIQYYAMTGGGYAILVYGYIRENCKSVELCYHLKSRS